MCVGVESGIEGATHTVEWRRREKNLLEPEGVADKESVNERTVAAGRAKSIRGQLNW